MLLCVGDLEQGFVRERLNARDARFERDGLLVVLGGLRVELDDADAASAERHRESQERQERSPVHVGSAASMRPPDLQKSAVRKRG